MPGNGRLAFAGTKKLTVSKARTLTITTTPNARGRLLLVHNRRPIVLRLWVAYRPTGGAQRRVRIEHVRIP